MKSVGNFVSKLTAILIEFKIEMKLFRILFKTGSPY